MPAKNFLRNLWDRFRALRHPDETHAELTEEFQFHLDMTSAEFMLRGMPEEEARKAAARKFGSALRIQERGNDVRGSAWIGEVWNDARFALRILRKTPSKTALLVLTLALGIGANTAVFSVIHSILLQPLPFPEPARLVLLHQANRVQAGGVSYPHFKDWREESRSFENMAVYSYDSAILTSGGESTRVFGATVSANLFDALRVAPLRGRLFRPEEDRWGSDDGSHPVVISDRLWHSRFQADADILGKPLVLEAKEFRIIGVIPTRLAYPIQSDPADYWITVAADADPANYGGSIPTSRGYPRYDAALARLKPGTTIEQARAEMNLIAGNIAREHPKATSMEQVRITPVLEDLVGPVRPMLLLLYGGVFCILLVACASAATLLVVSATAREKEFAVRAALGAKSARLIRQLLIESLVIAVSGGIAGVLLASSLVALFARLAPPDTPRLANLQVDPAVLLYAVLVSVATGLFFGLVPAVAAARIDLVARLKETSRSLKGRSRAFRSGTLLIGGQIALSMALTCCATVLGSSFLKILQSPKGFDPRQILTASVSLPVRGYPQGSKKVAQFYEALLQNVRTMPGVVSASAAQTLPLSGQNNSTTVEVIGRPERGRPAADLRFVEPEYFRTLGIPLASGRFFTERDTPDRPACVIVNQAFVRRFLQGQAEPYSARVRLGWGGDDPKQIIGVIADIRHNAVISQPSPEVYVPLAQFPVNDMAILVRTAEVPQTLAMALRRQVAALDRSVPVEQIRTLEEYFLLSIAPQRFLMWVLFTFAGSTLLLAAIGLYGVLSYSTRCRAQEFGIRMALGSTARGLVGLVLRQGLAIAVVGVVCGLALAAASTRLLSRWLYETSPTDPVSLIYAATVLLGISAAACLGPARRATTVSPLSSLRSD